MTLLIVQLICFLLALLYLRYKGNDWYFYRSASIAMGVMYLMAAVGHFMYQEGMQLMIPHWMPFKKTIVLLTGIYEVLLGAAFLYPNKRKAAAKISIAYLLITLPFNIYAAYHHVNYQAADYSGEGLVYLWFRVPLQIFWIGWSAFILRWNPLPFKKQPNNIDAIL